MHKNAGSGVIGILNDFDLASIMKPGSRSPEKRGWERTGTLPFLAVDLLEFHNGETRRWYRHDLESFAWCLLWEMLKKPDRKWTEETLENILTSKRGFLSNVENATDETIKQHWTFSSDFIQKWLNSIGSYDKKLARYWSERKRRGGSLPGKIVFRDMVDSKVSDAVHIQNAVRCAKVGGTHLNVPALVDESWINVELIESQE